MATEVWKKPQRCKDRAMKQQSNRGDWGVAVEVLERGRMFFVVSMESNRGAEDSPGGARTRMEQWRCGQNILQKQVLKH